MTVEFAMVLIVLLAMLYGIIEISRLMLINAEIQNAAREGAQYLALHPDAHPETCLREHIIGPKLVLINKNDNDLVIWPPTPIESGVLYSWKHLHIDYYWHSAVNFMPDISTLTLRPLDIRLRAESTTLIESLGTASEGGSGQCP